MKKHWRITFYITFLSLYVLEYVTHGKIQPIWVYTIVVVLGGVWAWAGFSRNDELSYFEADT